MSADERSYDFEIRTPSGDTLHGAFCGDGMCAIYDSAGRLMIVGPADQSWLRSFGTVNAGQLNRARLALEEGFSVFS